MIANNEIAYYYTIIGTLGMLIPNIQGFSFVVIGRNCHLILTIHYQDRYFLNINPCLSYFVSQCGTYSFTL